MTYYQILEKTPFSIQYYPAEPFRPIAECYLQMAEHDLKINAIHYYEWAVQQDDFFFYPLEIAECIVSYLENRRPFARYELKEMELDE
jgi:hypothetical protein